MSGIITFQYDAVERLKYVENEGHYFLLVPAFLTPGSYANRRISFIIDTGAFITVLSRQTALSLGFDKITPIAPNLSLSGFAGKCSANLIELPGLVIGGTILEGAKVAIPKELEGKNILGLNVLEHFNYLIDSANCKIYFARNEKNKIPNELKCKNIRVLSKG